LKRGGDDSCTDDMFLWFTRVYVGVKEVINLTGSSVFPKHLLRNKER
jgi:hypothetical protein